MLIGDWHIKFKNDVDKLDTQSYPDLLEEQIDLIFNEVILSFVKTRYGKNNIYKQGFQEIQKRTDDINTLVKNVEIVPNLISASNPKIYKVNLQDPLPDNNKYMFYLRGQVQTSSSKCAAKYVAPRLVQIDDLDSVLNDPFNKPIITEPVISFEDGGIYIYADSTFTVNKFKLTYLKMPVKVSIFDNISCDLPEHTHEEIIALAVEKLLERIESPRLGPTVELNKKIE